MNLIGGASTQSRARRPLPDGVIRAKTLGALGAHELVEFERDDGTVVESDLLTWVGGQAGLLWGANPNVDRLLHVDSCELEMTHGSYGHRIEHELADVLAELFGPNIVGGDVGVRFFQNGSDACAAAARLCRAETGRQTIATQGYHGAALDFAHLPQMAGQEFAATRHETFEFGDVARMRMVAQHAAGLMLEVPGLDDEAAIAGFLERARRAADDEFIPLVIDDVVGGFRFALGGTCERYGVQADLICLGKALSALGGVSALVGRMDLMERLAAAGTPGDVFYSTTFGGEPAGMAVALATVRWLQRHAREVYGPDGHLQTIGRALKDGFNAIGVPCVGQPERSAFAFKTDAEWIAFCQKMIGEGVMVHRPNFVTMAHTLEDVEMTIEAAERVTG